MTALLVVAHPDDEVLLAGATAYAWGQQGVDVATCIMVGAADARTLRPADDELADDTARAHAALGISTVHVGDFPNIRMNMVPHLDLVQFIEGVIRQVEPEVIVTHHPGDLNDDHQQTSAACQAAARLHQRGGSSTPLRSLLFGEVQSSTDWTFHGNTMPFTPNTYVEIGERGLEAKLDALACYRDVMRPYPHPRSVEAIRGLVAARGAEAGLKYAEAFQLGFLNATGLAT